MLPHIQVINQASSSFYDYTDVSRKDVGRKSQSYATRPKGVEETCASICDGGFLLILH